MQWGGLPEIPGQALEEQPPQCLKCNKDKCINKEEGALAG